MGIRKGEYWRCQNQACQGEILVTASSTLVEDKNPLCSCGDLMKKPCSAGDGIPSGDPGGESSLGRGAKPLA